MTIEKIIVIANILVATAFTCVALLDPTFSVISASVVIWLLVIGDAFAQTVIVDLKKRCATIPEA